MAVSDSLLKGVTISRLMGPNEANVYGNVHGGNILNLIDEAAIVISSRYCNNAPNKSDDAEDAATVLVRIEHMDFIQPMYIGEVAELSGEIVFTSPHSLEVIVLVHAENVVQSSRRLTNKARLWYCPMSVHRPDVMLAVPRMRYEDEAQEERGRQAYEAQRRERAKKCVHELCKPNYLFPPQETHPEPLTVSFSSTCLFVLIGPNDVTSQLFCRGGVLLKLMDECGAIVARKHCQHVTVTAGIEATNFHKSIPKGCLVNAYGWANFTSPHSVEVEVVVEFENPFKGGAQRERAVDSIFTFVSIDEHGKPLPIPPLKVVYPEEMERFSAGKQRYELRKMKRAQQQQQASPR